MTVTIYHNPRCGKSRAALRLIEERGIAPRIVLYLQSPPSVEELRTLLAKLGLSARGLLRTGEAEYRALGLDDPSLGEEAILRAMAVHPILIERPIVVNGRKAVVARPPEDALDVL